MSATGTEERIRELARDLEPVRPIPPLSALAIAVLALGLGAVALEWLLGGPGPRVWDGSPTAWAVFLGLLAVAGGATVGALGSAVPGREAVLRGGAALAALGLALTVLGGGWGLLHGAPAADGELLRGCWICFARAAKLGLPAGLLVCGFLGYAAVRRPGRGTALALAGGVALGAAAVHASCPDEGALHRLLAHGLAPVIAAALLTAPLAFAVARWVRGR